MTNYRLAIAGSLKSDNGLRAFSSLHQVFQSLIGHFLSDLTVFQMMHVSGHKEHPSIAAVKWLHLPIQNPAVPENRKFRVCVCEGEGSKCPPIPFFFIS